ncbi:MAG: protein kinase, partial [Thermoanaerobaculia bacterium]|nr:protein kinase [Thermoanaerobaculia bacterium]
MRYRIQELLGAGGMGQVYKAWDPVLDRPVALKYLRGDDPKLMERMLREARAQAKVAHENVCQVYETGEDEGKAFIAMQYVDGVSLDEAATEMTLEEKLDVLRRVAEAVQAAHNQGLIHRDLKPSNVMVVRTEGGGWHPFVVDFGIALDEEATLLTTAGKILGTPAYMAPEQVTGSREGLDRRLDVYSLGAMLYQLLSGEPPHAGQSQMEVLVSVAEGEPTPLGRSDPSIPRDLRIIVEHCLEREPGRRYPSARLLAEDLDRFLQGEPILARPPSLGYRLRKALLRHKAVAAVTLVAVLAVLSLLVAGIAREARARERARLAQRFGQEAERLASFTRMVYLAPLHDTRSDEEVLRVRMETLDAERSRLGTMAEGPGRYALGMGSLSLGDLEEARADLERAWEAGFREPRVALALGRTHGRLYQRAIASLRDLDPELFEVESAEARERHLEPALRFLRAGVEGESSGSYVEALLAYYEDRLEEAERLAGEALADQPFLYDAAL